jgi:hypothetical protein
MVSRLPVPSLPADEAAGGGDRYSAFSVIWRFNAERLLAGMFIGGSGSGYYNPLLCGILRPFLFL